MYSDKTLLIVDDSPVERHIIKEAIKSLGFAQILEADNGENGIKLAIESRPHIILMDVVMPGINGFQATRQIKTNPDLKDTPVIMCTTKSQETDKTWGARQGASAYVTKPVDATLLIAEIKRLLK